MFEPIMIALMIYAVYKLCSEPATIVRETRNKEGKTVLVERVTDDDQEKVVERLWSSKRPESARKA